MKTLKETIKENESILKEYFKRLSLEYDKHIKEITIEVMGRDIVCNIFCDFRDCEEVQKWFDKVGEEGELELYHELKDRRIQEYRIDWKEALELIRVEGRDKKIDQILRDTPISQSDS